MVTAPAGNNNGRAGWVMRNSTRTNRDRNIAILSGRCSGTTRNIWRLGEAVYLSAASAQDRTAETYARGWTWNQVIDDYAGWPDGRLRNAKCPGTTDNMHRPEFGIHGKRCWLVTLIEMLWREMVPIWSWWINEGKVEGRKEMEWKQNEHGMEGMEWGWGNGNSCRIHRGPHLRLILETTPQKEMVVIRHFAPMINKGNPRAKRAKSRGSGRWMPRLRR